MSTNPSMTPNSTELEAAELSLRALLQRAFAEGHRIADFDRSARVYLLAR